MANPPAIPPGSMPNATQDYQNAMTIRTQFQADNAKQAADRAEILHGKPMPQLTPDEITQNYAYLNGTAQPDVDTLKGGTGAGGAGMSTVLGNGAFSNIFAMMQMQNNDYQNAETLRAQMAVEGDLTQQQRMALLQNAKTNQLTGQTAGSLTKIFSQRYQRQMEDDAVGTATKRNPSDSPETAALRSGYGNAYNRARKEWGDGLALAQKLGPGTHQVGDDNVDIQYTNCPGGNRTIQITTTHPDGSSKTVQVAADSANVDDFDAKGQKTGSLTQSGTSVTQRDGEGDTKYYGLNDQGEPSN